MTVTSNISTLHFESNLPNIDVFTKAACTLFQRYLNEEGRLRKTVDAFGLSHQVLSSSDKFVRLPPSSWGR